MRRMTRSLRLLTVILLVAGIGYFGYMGWEGSDRLVNLDHPNRDCRTPAQIGMAYEAINYDIATDVALLEREADPWECSAPGAAPGEDLVSSDGVRLAGWYVPAASGIGPEGPTVVLSHGWNDNKSGLLEDVVFFHDDFNAVLFDYRNHGQSQDSATTQGINEQRDLAAVLDWLADTKGPDTVVVWGQSMGGHTAVNVAADDERVDGLILDVTHSRVGVPMVNRIRLENYPFGEIGHLAIWLGTWVRTGVDVFGDDPITAIDDLGDRPVLIVHGGLDDTIPVSDVEELLGAALDAGVDARLQLCPEAGHGGVSAECPTEYARWMDDFMADVTGGAAGSASPVCNNELSAERCAIGDRARAAH